MIPSILSHHLQVGLGDYLKTTFPIGTPFFERMLDDFLREDNELFKDPYVSVQLPFRQVKPDELERSFFNGVKPANRPYLHQVKAFGRLTGDVPQSTLIATGTGSGKTECFLLPILEHCYRTHEQRGIKAILIYPMNALATDQAKRIARLIWDNPALKGKITAGLYVGENEKTPRKTMEPDGIITDKELLRKMPPDILLTNYKMLDYLLIRPKDASLWELNDPATLRYLVVDELHTFDGAQGTDLACLIRRLKSRLETPKDYLCCVGTSATLGGDACHDDLLQYATKVFGETFPPEALVGETRLSAQEFLEDYPVTTFTFPSPEDMIPLLKDPGKNGPEMAKVLARLWFNEDGSDGWELRLGEHLKGHHFFQSLLKILRGRSLSYSKLLKALEQVLPEWDSATFETRCAWLDSILALASVARVWQGDRLSPFVNLRIQLWLREMRRMVASISLRPRLRFSNDLKAEELKTHLPIVHCMDCGATGWAGLYQQQNKAIESDLHEFYQAFFKNRVEVSFLFPDTRDIDPREGKSSWFCGNCLSLQTQEGPCENCGHKHTIQVFIPYSCRQTKDNKLVGHHDCPYCGSSDALTILGAQAATMTSVLIDQLYASPLNDDKKLLTFSDSVQDASHRAGFFGARTQSFTFRTALYHFLQESSQSLTLANLGREFCQYWHHRMTDEEFVAGFIPSSLFWMQDYEYLRAKNALPENSSLVRMVEQRLAWNSYIEFCLRSRIGRTLEKSNRAIGCCPADEIESACNKIREVLSNEIGSLRNLESPEVRRFVLGLLYHLRIQGGIGLPDLERYYIQTSGNAYMLNIRNSVPGFGTRRPRFLATFSAKGAFEAFANNPGEREAWLQEWACKCWAKHDQSLLRADLRDAIRETIGRLVADGLLKEWELKGNKVWGIPPEKIAITQNVVQIRCKACHQRISVPTSEDWAGTPCIRPGCKGQYEIDARDADYYAHLYQCGDLARIFAFEHTGLLDRDYRESLENAFIRGGDKRKPWDPNLLSCTPTLEMGIDIGDLSTVALCSVPPAQANYLQRIGRAGRRDGNSLTLTVANAKPHDLYFYSEPEEMIAGNVQTPGVFLNAAAVLERQLAAYCLDNWVATGLSPMAIPDDLKSVLHHVKNQRTELFPFNFLNFLKKHEQQLLAGFIALFDPELSQSAVGPLTAFLTGSNAMEGSFSFKLLNALLLVQRQVDGLQSNIRRLRDGIRKMEQDTAKDQDHAERLAELKSERYGLQDLVKSLQDRSLYQFLTDEGLLPNYAFPEEGVTLQSLIYRKRDKAEDGSNYDKTIFSYQRPARTALGELAPASHFYAEGREVVIDQVDLTLSDLETWRFCPECSQSIRLGAEELPACPRCGSPLWADQGQKRQMLRMRQVFATTEDKRSRFGDDKDERETVFFKRHLLVSTEKGDIVKAYKFKDDEHPFGLEYLSKATFREINFGENAEDGQDWCLDGIRLRNKGFSICRHCGKVQSAKPGAELKHTFSCKSRDKDSSENLLDVIYLYREFASEAIKIFLPFGSDFETLMPSFVAALQVGLKKYFRGNIDHLQSALTSEPIPDSSLRKRYLVLYDTVPGGTGYLKQLANNPDEVIAVLKLALNHIRACSCQQDPEKDGCYRCVYVYRNSREMAKISRSKAIETLVDIVDHASGWEEVDSLQGISINSLLDSDLEGRFLQALAKYPECNMKAEVVNGKPGYHLTVRAQTYRVEPQVPIGQADGVEAMMVADFVLWPVRQTSEQKPIVVFTDGFTYHKDRIQRDLQQRMALLKSGRFHVWSLGYNDVENQFSAKDSYFTNALDLKGLPLGGNFPRMLELYKLQSMVPLPSRNSFDMLMDFLKNPSEKDWSLTAFLLGAVAVEKGMSQTSWCQDLEGCLETGALDHFKSLSESALYGHQRNPVFDWWVRMPSEALKQKDFEAMNLFARLNVGEIAQLEKEYSKHWLGFLRLCNLFQFLPGFMASTSEGWLEWSEPRNVAIATSTPGPKTEDDWQEVFALVDPKWHPKITAFSEVGLPVPEPGYELTNGSGKVVATAELAWPSQKIACLLPEEREFEGEFTQQGWRVFDLETVDPKSL